MEYIIKDADNGLVVTWKEENLDSEMVEHIMVFEADGEEDELRVDPEWVINFLYFTKEKVCDCYYSKHKQRNIVIHFDTEEEEGEAVIH